MRKLLYKKHKLIGNKGFSLVELIIVIAIMAVLMAILAPQLIRYVEKSRTQADDTAAGEILNAVKVAMADPVIYAALTNTMTVKWDAVGGTILSSTTDQSLADEVKTVITPVPTAKSQTHKATTMDVYTITLTLDANNTMIANGVWGAT